MTAPDYVGARFAAYRAHEKANGREPLSWAAWLRAGEPALSAPLVKAVVVYQPWATLIALEVKRVETRPLPPGGFPRPDGVRQYPGLSVEPGERIAIVAAATPWSYYDTAKMPGAPVAWEALAVAVGWTEGGRDLWSAVRGGGGVRHLTVLGSIVCTSVLAEALPVVEGLVDSRPAWTDRWIARPSLGGLAVWTREPPRIVPRRIDSESPLGSYEPGRWGWSLESTHRLLLPVPCGRADGIRNSQGIFRLPPNVAAMIPNNNPTLEVTP